MTFHRYALNRALATTTPIDGRTLEIGNGRRRRGIETGARVTLDIDVSRRPRIQSDGRALPFADHTFDAVICCETLQYVSNADRALQEIRRVLVRGGRLLLSLPAWLPPQADEFKRDRWFWLAQRWREEATARFQVEFVGFHVERIRPLWPPWRWRTSGWFVEARA